jgi:septal ring-binding cell division protein DamX
MKTKNHSENEHASNSQPDPRQKRSVLWIGVILFISGWIFFLGVIVGRGTAPALFDYKRIETEITMLAKTFTDSRKAHNEKETEILTTQAELGYPEELKKKTEDVVKMPMPISETAVKTAETPKPVKQEPAQVLPSSAPPAPVKSDIQASVKPETIEHAPDSTKTEPEAKIKSMYDVKTSPAREKAPERAALTVPERTAPAAPERTPSAVPKPPPPASDNKAATAQPVAIHLTSMVDKKSADTLIESLRSKGIPASKMPKMVQGKGVWYTIVIGKYASSTEADAMLNRLRQENMDASLVKQ